MSAQVLNPEESVRTFSAHILYGKKHLHDYQLLMNDTYFLRNYYYV